MLLDVKHAIPFYYFCSFDLMFLMIENCVICIYNIKNENIFVSCQKLIQNLNSLRLSLKCFN